MIISLIVAMDRNRVIGAEGELPWHLPADLKFFKRVTMGKPIIMGRKTFQSIGKPLAGRHNIVMTRDESYQAPGCTVVHGVDEALLAVAEAPEVMVIGGAQIYRQFLPYSERFYLTCIDGTFQGDTVFPDISEDGWRRVWEEAHEADERNPYAFRWLILERTGGIAKGPPQTRAAKKTA